MKTQKSATSFTAGLLVLIVSLVSIQTPAYAAMMTTQQLAAEDMLQADRTALQQRLLQDDVRTELLSLGVSPESVENRINNLSPGERAQINARLDSLPAGGDGLGTVALVLLILILLEVTGVIDIFPRL
jgi:hypothetical protein